MTVKPTTHEMLGFNELIRMESVDLQKTQAMMPMIADPELREATSGCIQRSKAHVKAMVDFVQAAQVVQ